MSVVAGLDVGNATTELVVADTSRAGDLVWRGTRPTSGPKGSHESLAAAADLVRRAERELGRRCDAIAVARLRPVRTVALRAPSAARRRGPVRRLDGGDARTAAGCGSAVGRHVPLADVVAAATPAPGPVVVSVPAQTDFEEAAAALRSALERGWDVAGALVAGDEAVLIANRLPVDLPIVDEVDVARLRRGERVALEARPTGTPIRTLADPMALASALGLAADRLDAVAAFCRDVADARALAVAARADDDPDPGPAEGLWVEAADGAALRQLDVSRDGDAIRRLVPGAARALVRAGGHGRTREAIDDLFVVDLADVDDGAWVRRGVVELVARPAATLAGGRAADVATALEELTGRPVVTAGEEAAAGAVGARTTPGAPADCAVCDLGGGTIDAVLGDRSVVAAGGGELLTLCVALALRVPRGLAERAKRRPAVRIETPHLAHDEGGGRTFLERQAPRAALGRLCVESRGELLPFHDRLAPEEWRSLRIAIKRAAVGANVERCLGGLGGTPEALLLAGGAARDDEVVRIVADRLGAGAAGGGPVVARADVAGAFGPRFAVAHGLLRQLVGGGRPPARRRPAADRDGAAALRSA